MKLINIINPAVVISDLALICQPEDVVLLRQDAVYLCLRDDIRWPTTRLYALETDLQVRQIKAPTGIATATAGYWLELSINAQQVLLWQS